MARQIPSRLAHWIDQHKNIVQPYALSALVDIWFDEGGTEPSGDGAPKKPILPTLIPGAVLESMRAGLTSLVLEAGKPTVVKLPTPRELVEALLKAGFSQAQIAAQSEVSQAMVNKILRKNDNCRADMYRALLALHARTCMGL